jgi:hypothetical protein
MSKLGLGVIAGAAGTLALDVATYLDMAIRGRAASDVPADLAGELMDSLGVRLGSGDTAAHRRSALGALFGYTTGIGLSVLYGVLRPRLEDVPLPISAAAVGLGAMALSDATAIAYDVTNPAEWGVMGWASDIFFHLIYGYITVAVYEALADE